MLVGRELFLKCPPGLYPRRTGHGPGTRAHGHRPTVRVPLIAAGVFVILATVWNRLTNNRAQGEQLTRYQGAQLTATGPRATIRPGPAQGARATAPVPGCDIPGRPPARRDAMGAGPRLARASSLRYAAGPVPVRVNKQTRPGRQGFRYKKTRPGPGSRLQLQRLGGELGPLGLPCIGAGR
jgi:hypothetical protein